MLPKKPKTNKPAKQTSNKSDKDATPASSIGILDLDKDIFTAMESVVPEKEMTEIKFNLAKTNRHFNAMFKENLNEKAYLALLQAVIDEKPEEIKKILGSYPNLLFIKAPKETKVESKYTWATFDLKGESPLSIAIKRKQLNIVKVLLGCYDKQKRTDDLRVTDKVFLDECYNAFTPYNTEKNNVTGEDSIVVPDSYRIEAESLIQVFISETLPNGAPNIHDKQPIKLSDSTELALSALFDRLVPKKPVKLNEYPDAELFLLALYFAYHKNFSSFKNMDQRAAFCVRVIGLTQSTLCPETADMFAHGFYDTIRKKPSSKTPPFKNIYRPTRDIQTHLGGNYFISDNGSWCAAESIGNGIGTPGMIIDDYPKFMLSKNKNFVEYIHDRQHPPTLMEKVRRAFK